MKRYSNRLPLLGFLLFSAFAVRSQTLTIYTTAEKTDNRISKTGTASFAQYGQPKENEVCVFVDPTHSFQTMIGIGGAITDASAETWAKLPADKQKQLITAYYDTINGIGYNLGRTNINSCDFSSDMYTYVKDGDQELKTFDISHDKVHRLPMIKQIIAATNNRLTLYVSPWSPPAWMKDNNSMIHAGKLLPQYKQAWSNYYVKYIQALEKEGIPVWGLTLQNEPMANQIWESCYYSAEDERDYIRDYLGPTLHNSGMADKKLIAWDHNRDLIYQQASTILNDKEAAKYIWGIGYHWYETWTGSAMQFNNVRLVAEAFPDKKLIFTEGCAERFDFSKIGLWMWGEKYGHSMINDLNNGTVAWTDWNILVDEQGGPNHVGNFCFAPVVGDTRKGELIFTSSYYYIGHFSKFIRPGAKRIVSSSNRDLLETTAFQNVDGKTVIVVMNQSDKSIPYLLWMAGKAAKLESLPHSIVTMIF